MYDKGSMNNFSAPASLRYYTDARDRKKAKNDITKEGVIVNTFIKDVDTYYADSEVRDTPLPQEMFQKKEKVANKWYEHPLVPIIATPLIILGVAAGLSKVYKSSLINKYKITEKMRIPTQGRLIAVNNDNTMSLLMLVQEPSWKNMQVATAVIAASSVAFIMKTAVDGFKEVLVKKQEADIKRDKEEKLIDVETRSFSGKNQIIRNLLSEKATEIDLYLNKEKNNNKKLNFGKNEPFFKENNNKSKETDFTSKTILYTAIAVTTLAVSALLTRSIFKNLRTVAKDLTEKASEATKNLAIDLKKIKKPEELDKVLIDTKISDKAKDYVRNEWGKIHSPSGFAPTPELIAGTRGKTGFSSVVLAEASSFIYTWLINKNPQTQTLATVMCSAAALGYIGKKTVEGIKEVKVEKVNANTEVELQDRLVQVDLKNFYAKKKSYVEPFMDDFKEKIKTPRSKEELKRMKENILTEIKSGPPFVYS